MRLSDKLYQIFLITTAFFQWSTINDRDKRIISDFKVAALREALNVEVKGSFLFMLTQRRKEKILLRIYLIGFFFKSN